MNSDPELKEWTSDWQTGEERESSAEAIRYYAQGRSRFMWKWMLSELAVAVVALPLLAYMGWNATDPVERWAMGLLAAITVAAMNVGWWNWRGSLLASARTTTEFVSVSAERLRRMRQAWRIGWIVLIAEVGVFSVWIWNMLYAGTRDHTPFAERFSWGWLAFMSLAAVAFLLRMHRWIQRDEAKFEELKRELAVGSGTFTWQKDAELATPSETATFRSVKVPDPTGQRPPESGPGRESRLRGRLRSRNRGVPR